MVAKKTPNNNNSKGPSVDSKSSGSSSVEKPVAKSVMVSKKGNEKIAELASQIAKESKSYNDWVWLTAEAQLKVRNKKQPTEKEIRSAAEQLFNQHFSIENLQWKIAEFRLS